MCNPGLIGLGLAIVSAAGTAVQQSDNARKQASYQDRLARSTEQNAAVAAESDYVAQLEQLNQVRAAATEESLRTSQELEKAKATLRVGAETAGLSEGVVDDLRAGLAVQAAQDAAIDARNLTFEENQIMRGVDKILATQQSRLNAAMPSPIQGIDYGRMIGTLGQGIGSYSQYQASRGRGFFGGELPDGQ